MMISNNLSYKDRNLKNIKNEQTIPFKELWM